jgi:hypothetical protein
LGKLTGSADASALLGGIDLLDYVMMEFVSANIARERRRIGITGGGSPEKRQWEQDHLLDGQEFNPF